MKYQIIFFCLLAYFISWGTKFLLAAPGAGMFNHNIPPGLLQIIAQFGPSIAGVIMIMASSGKKGLFALVNNLSTFNIHLKWYIFALFFELILLNVIVVFSGSLNLLAIRPGSAIWLVSMKNFLINTFYLTLLTGIGEEIGWRGFLLPRLQSSLPIIIATLLLALINSFWHLRTTDLEILLSGDLSGFWNSFLPDMGLRLFISIPVLFVIVYLYNKTKGSLVIMVLFHGASNASYEYVKEITGNSDPSFILPYFAGLVWISLVFFIPAILKLSKAKKLVTVSIP